MNKLKIRYASRVILLLSTFSFASSIARARSLTETQSTASSILQKQQIQLDAASLRDFDTIFQAIASQTHVTILVEGVPLHASLTPAQIAAIHADVPVDHSVPLLVEIESIAAAFAYDVEQADEHTFLLRKQYHDPNDLPCVTYAEIVHFLKEVDKIPGAYSPPGSPRKLLLQVRFGNSFSPDQLARVRDGVSVSDLSAEQRDLAVSVAGAMWIGTKLENIRQALKELTLLGDTRAQFTWFKFGEMSAFGYEGPFGPDEMILPRPLNNRFLARTGSGQSIGAGDPSDPDPTIPTPLDRALAPGMLANRLPSTRTLAEFSRATVAPSEKATLTVDDALADKPFSLFGAQYSTRGHLIRSLAALYGLLLRVPKVNDFTITLPEARPIQDGADIPTEVQRVTPLPIARFLSAHQQRDSVLMQSGMTAAVPPRLSASQKNMLEMDRVQKKQGEANASHAAAMQVYYFPAVRRLLVLTQSTVPTPQSPPIPVKSTAPEVLRLIALMRLAGSPLGDLESLARLEVPSIISAPATMHVMVTKKKNGLVINFGPAVRDAQGMFALQLGEGITNPPKEDSPFPEELDGAREIFKSGKVYPRPI